MHSIRVGLIHELPFKDRLVVTRSEAASMMGVSVGYFNKLVKLGVAPEPLPLPGRVKRWSKAQIHRSIDGRYGTSESGESGNEWDDLLR